MTDSGHTQTVAYIAVGGAHKLLRFALDPSTGDLTLLEELPLGGAPGPLAVDPRQQVLYVGLRSTNQLVSYRINAPDGSLTPFGPTVTLDTDPCYLAVDRSGRWLLAAYYQGGKATVHPLLADGTIGGEPVCTVVTEPYAHCIETDPTNRFAFLPHVAESNVIYQYHFDDATGQLTPNTPARLTPAPNIGPRHYVYHPTQPILYFSNEQAGSVTAYHLEPQGTLTALQTLSTLPATFQGENTCAQIHLHPSGRWLYVSNRGHDSIACFAIDEHTGGLTSLGQQPTEPIPRAFNLDPSGHFLYVSGQGNGQLTAYRIDQATGLLHRGATYQVGERPMWVMLLALGA